MTPSEALKYFRSDLTPFERLEVFKYKRVWFLGTNPQEKVYGSLHLSNNFGYDDKYGNYIFAYGDHLAYRYELLDEIGSGSFGVVLKCKDHKTMQYVAVKMHHSTNGSFIDDKEVKIMAYLREKDVDRTGNIVHMLAHFVFRSHLFIVFELEGTDLGQMSESMDGRGLGMVEIRRYAISLLKCLSFLKKAGIVHGDIKPNNIVMSLKDPFTVKLIDFGGSGQEPQRSIAHTINYTSPEAMLGKYFTTAHDMWSFGCTLIELYTGQCLFGGDNTSGVVSEMVKMLGKPPSVVFGDSPEWQYFFGSGSNSGSSGSYSGSSGSYSGSSGSYSGSSGSYSGSSGSYSEISVSYSGSSGSYSERSGSYSEISGSSSGISVSNSRSHGSHSSDRGFSSSVYTELSSNLFEWGCEGISYNCISLEERKSILESQLRISNLEFVDFVARCLDYEPNKRLTPEEAMQHPWIEQHQLYPPRTLSGMVRENPILSTIVQL